MVAGCVEPQEPTVPDSALETEALNFYRVHEVIHKETDGHYGTIMTLTGLTNRECSIDAVLTGISQHSGPTDFVFVMREDGGGAGSAGGKGPANAWVHAGPALVNSAPDSGAPYESKTRISGTYSGDLLVVAAHARPLSHQSDASGPVTSLTVSCDEPVEAVATPIARMHAFDLMHFGDGAGAGGGGVTVVEGGRVSVEMPGRAAVLAASFPSSVQGSGQLTIESSSGSKQVALDDSGIVYAPTMDLQALQLDWRGNEYLYVGAIGLPE